MYGDWNGCAKESVPFSMGRFYYEDINDIDFNKILTDAIGAPPSDMYDPHAHHILFKHGRGETQQELVQRGQRILVEMYDIDPITGLEVLGWAPNRVVGQHSTETLESLINDIVDVADREGSREEMEAILNKHKQEAKKRNVCKKKIGG